MKNEKRGKLGFRFYGVGMYWCFSQSVGVMVILTLYNKCIDKFLIEVNIEVFNVS